MVRGGLRGWCALAAFGMGLVAGCAGPGVAREDDFAPGGRLVVQDDKADGQVVRVNRQEVSINLGKKDRVRPGMVFTLYDSRTGVEPGEPGNGKIEVMEVYGEFSICRVREMVKNRGIQTRDFVYNRVYHHDKNRALRFAVFGEFDLNGDGVATAAEREQLELMVTARGGKLDKEVGVKTDYLVVGSRPASPMVRPLDTSTTQAGGIVAVRGQEQRGYDGQIVQARLWAVPVLNTNRLLRMLEWEMAAR
jgi:hypothetical protein